MILSELRAAEEKRKMVEEITENVIQRISANVDIQKAILEIQELKKLLESLGQ